MAIKHKFVAEKGDLVTSTAWNDEHKIEDFTIKALHIDNNQITTDHLTNNAVTTEKIQDGAITTAKIQNSSITPIKLNSINSPYDGYVPSYDSETGKFEWILTSGGVTKHTELTDKEVNGVIDHADNSITTAKIQDNAITTAKIQSGAITTTKIQDNAVTTEKIQDNAISTAKIQDGAVTPAKLSFYPFRVVQYFELTSAQTEIEITGFDRAKNKFYYIDIFVYNGGTASGSATMLLGTSTGYPSYNDYIYQKLTVSGTSVSASQSSANNLPEAIVTTPSNKSSITRVIIQTNPVFPYHVTFSVTSGTQNKLVEYSGTVSNGSSDLNITRVKFTGSVTNFFGAGTKVIAYAPEFP
jgi:hypothetical protein